MRDAIRSNNPNRILTGIDFSNAAMTAVWRAVRLARACDGQVELMHVIRPSEAPVYRVPGWEVDRRRLVAEAHAKLDAIASRAEARFGVQARVHVAIGVPHAEIAARAESIGARLVVIGSHAERAVRDLWVGATAQRLRRLLRGPLLIARNSSGRRYERALIAVEFNAASADAARAAARLLPDASLHFVHVCDPAVGLRLSRVGASEKAISEHRNQALLEASHRLDNFVRTNGLQSRRGSAIVMLGHVARCIKDAAAQVGAAIVVFGAKGKSRFEANLLGSVSEEFVSGTGHDVLLVRATGKVRAHRLPDSGPIGASDSAKAVA